MSVQAENFQASDPGVSGALQAGCKLLLELFKPVEGPRIIPIFWGPELVGVNVAATNQGVHELEDDQEGVQVFASISALPAATLGAIVVPAHVSVTETKHARVENSNHTTGVVSSLLFDADGGVSKRTQNEKSKRLSNSDPPKHARIASSGFEVTDQIVNIGDLRAFLSFVVLDAAIAIRAKEKN